MADEKAASQPDHDAADELITEQHSVVRAVGNEPAGTRAGGGIATDAPTLQQAAAPGGATSVIDATPEEIGGEHAVPGYYTQQPDRKRWRLSGAVLLWAGIGVLVLALVGLNIVQLISRQNANLQAQRTLAAQVSADHEALQAAVVTQQSHDQKALSSAVSRQIAKDDATKAADVRRSYTQGQSAGYSAGNSSGYSSGFSAGNTSGYQSGANNALNNSDATCSNDPSVTWLPYC